MSNILARQPDLTIGLVADEVVVDDAPVPEGAGVLGELHQRLQSRGIQRIGISRGVTADEIITLVQAINAADGGETGGLAMKRLADGGLELPHIHVGRIRIEERLEASVADMATIRRLYSEAVSTADRIWESAQANGLTSAEEVRHVVQSLAQAVSQNRTALLVADRAPQLRQLHVHAHGERVDPHDGAGARPRHRRRAAARVRHGRPDARHRQGPDAAARSSTSRTG